MANRYPGTAPPRDGHHCDLGVVVVPILFLPLPDLSFYPGEGAVWLETLSLKGS